MLTKKILSTALVAAAVTAGGAAAAVIGAPVISGAQDAGTPTTTAPATANPNPSDPAAPPADGTRPDRGTAPGDRMKGGHVGPDGKKEEVLTGETAEKVKAAALAANPGATVDRAENDAEGSPYEAHITKADGTHVTVKIDTNFVVTATEDGPGPGGHGGPGRHGGPGHGTPLAGAEADQVKAAVIAANPGATVDRAEKDEDGTFDAHITKADGTRARVELDAGFVVTSTDDAPARPAR